MGMKRGREKSQASACAEEEKKDISEKGGALTLHFHPMKKNKEKKEGKITFEHHRPGKEKKENSLKGKSVTKRRASPSLSGGEEKRKDHLRGKGN